MRETKNKKKNGGVEGEIEAGRLRPEEEGERKKKEKKILWMKVSEGRNAV